jgi:pro-kumamolisin-like protein
MHLGRRRAAAELPDHHVRPQRRRAPRWPTFSIKLSSRLQVNLPDKAIKGDISKHDEPMDLLVSLELPADVSEQLEAKVARGEVVPADELAAMSSPQVIRDRLVAWLTSHGFTVDRVSADGTSVYATSTVSNIAEQVQVEMARVTRDGITYNAARTPPSLPDDAGDGVRAIIGLQPFRQATKQSRRGALLSAATA